MISLVTINAALADLGPSTTIPRGTVLGLRTIGAEIAKLLNARAVRIEWWQSQPNGLSVFRNARAQRDIAQIDKQLTDMHATVVSLYRSLLAFGVAPADEGLALPPLPADLLAEDPPMKPLSVGQTQNNPPKTHGEDLGRIAAPKPVQAKPNAVPPYPAPLRAAAAPMAAPVKMDVHERHARDLLNRFGLGVEHLSTVTEISKAGQDSHGRSAEVHCRVLSFRGGVPLPVGQDNRPAFKFATLRG